MSAQDSLVLRQKLEAMVVSELAGKLQKNEISGDRAKEVAQIFLKTVPEDISHLQLLTAIAGLDDKVGELAGVVYEILSENDNVQKEQELQKVRSIINSIKNNG